MAMQNYTPMRLAPSLDVGLRNDLLKVDRFLRQLTPFAARTPSFPQGTAASQIDLNLFLYLPGRSPFQRAEGTVVFSAKTQDEAQVLNDSAFRGLTILGQTNLGLQPITHTVYFQPDSTAGASIVRKWIFPSITGSATDTFTFLTAEGSQTVTNKTITAGSIYVGTAAARNIFINSNNTLQQFFIKPNTGFPVSSGPPTPNQTPTLWLPSLDLTVPTTDRHTFMMLHASITAPFTPGSVPYGNSGGTEMEMLPAGSNGTLLQYNVGETVAGCTWSAGGFAITGVFDVTKTRVGMRVIGGTSASICVDEGTHITAVTATTLTVDTALVGNSVGTTVTTHGPTWSSSISSLSFVDSGFKIIGSGDATKIVQFEVDGLTTATTRTATVRDWDGTLVVANGVGTSTQLLQSNGTGTPPSWVTVAGTSTEFPDDTFRVIDNADTSKKMAFEASGITTATTRTITLPNFDGTVALFRGDKLRIGDTSAPTHRLELLGGSTAFAPLQIDSGTVQTVPTAGCLEFDVSGLLYFTASATRRLFLFHADSTPAGVDRIPFAQTGGWMGDSANLKFVTGTNTLTVIGAIGTTTLTASGKVIFGGLADDTTSKVQIDYTDSSTGVVNIIGLFGQLRASPASSSSTNFLGYDGGVRVDGAGNLTQSGPGLGAIGLRGLVTINTGATVDSVTGLNGLIYTEGGAPTVTNAFAVVARWAHFSGTITNAYGLYAQDPNQLGHTVTNNYMLYIADAVGGSSTNWAIYSAGGNSSLAGKVRLGDNTSPTHRLEMVAGTTSVAPLKLVAGTNLSAPVAGAVEFDGTRLYVTDSVPTRQTVAYLSDIVVTAPSIARTFMLMGG